MRSFDRKVAVGLVLVVVVLAGTCLAGGTKQQHSMSRSRVLRADTLLAPLRPVQSIVLTVTATASYDSVTKWWTYYYTVLNEPTSQNALETFAIRPLWKPVQIVAPLHWSGSYGSEGDSVAVAWSVTDFGPDPPGWNGVQLYAGPYHPQPGQSTSGFSVVSRQGPASIQYFAQGFDTLQVASEEEGVDSSPSTFDSGVTGTTIGPDVQSVTGVAQSEPTGQPTAYFLPAAPNPARGSVSFAYYLPRSTEVQVTVFDVRGRRIDTVRLGKQPAGYHATTWNPARAVASGVYFYRLSVDGRQIDERKLVLVR